MSKVSFRARQIDFNKPLPILKDGSDILAEFSENALVNRGVPQIPSGMEKEEENEHHFVEVIQALQLNSGADVKIPVPDIIDRSVSYKKLYANEFILPPQLVHIRNVVLSEDEPTEYDMDTDDEEWLGRSQLDVSPRKFETMIDRLERGCGQKVMNLEEANCLLQDDPSLVIAVYDYWLNKRVQSRQPLLFTVRQEKRDNGSNADPYVAFRRRSEKMQTRKNRKNDEQSYEKMLILRDQMEALGDILSSLVKRETTKEMLVQNDLRLLDARFRLQDWDGLHLLEAENTARRAQHTMENPPTSSPKDPPRRRSTRKRKLTHRILNLSMKSDDLSDVEPEVFPDEPFAFVRLQGCQYLRPRDANDDSNSGRSREPPHLRYRLTTVPSVCHPDRRSYTGYIRRRLGRGGRVVCDRLRPPSDLVEYFRGYDRLYSRVPHETPNANLSAYLHNRQSLAKDVDLLRRLKPILLANHRRWPSFHWPICTDFKQPPSFEPLAHNPWRSAAVHTTFPESSSFPTQSTASVQSSDKSGLHSSSSLLSGFNGVNPVSFECSGSVDLSTSVAVVQEDESDENLQKHSSANDTKFPEVRKQGGPLCWNKKAASTPPSFWRNMTKFGAAQTSRSSKPRIEESTTSSANGFSARSMYTSSDRLRLKDSVLLPSKTCALTRECASRESGVPGPQLQTANGVNPSQFFQLPI